MSNQRSVAKHLAKVMGNLFVEFQDGSYSPNPFTSRSMWADVVIWAASHGYDVAIHDDASFCMTAYSVYTSTFDWPGSTETNHIEATMTAIALATGWTGGKIDE
jgi:hypothetical protein